MYVVDVEFHPKLDILTHQPNEPSGNKTIQLRDPGEGTSSGIISQAPKPNPPHDKCNNPNIHIIIFSCILVINKTISHSTCVVGLTL